jgi:fatty acid desaturase
LPTQDYSLTAVEALQTRIGSGIMAGSIGIWLFFVQHQFEDAYWNSGPDWSFTDAALPGSSFLRLPAGLRFCTGNIGYHHVHHLNALIPNYNLRRAPEQTPALHDVPTLSLADGLRATRLKLWDERSQRLVGFRAARRACVAGGVPAPPPSVPEQLTFRGNPGMLLTSARSGRAMSPMTQCPRS